MGGAVGGLAGGGGGGGKGGGDSGNTGADAALAQWALGQNIQAIHNRYQQLGLGVPSDTSAGAGARAAAAGTNLTYGSPSTMEGQDIGTIPTETGGAMGAAHALMGELFNPVNAAGLGPGGSLQQLAQAQGQQQTSDLNSGFAAGSSGGGQGGSFGDSLTG